jgi:transposase-like protein
MTVSNELIDHLLADYKKPEDLIGENGLLNQLTKRLVERALEAEMAEHLGHGKNEPVANPKGNTRNGKSKKTLKGEFGELPIDIPRDRDGSFEPQIVPKHQTRWTGFDDKILSLYPPEVRRIIYTTNAIESVNMSLRKITKNRGAFPSDDALLKLFYLALNNIAKKWTMPVQNWKPVLNRFTIQFGERMPTN